MNTRWKKQTTFSSNARINLYAFLKRSAALNDLFKHPGMQKLWPQMYKLLLVHVKAYACIWQ